MRNNYRSTGDILDSLAWEALRRNGGEPISLDQVETMFVELLQHQGGCECGQCHWVQEAKRDKAFRSAEYWSRHQKPCEKF